MEEVKSKNAGFLNRVIDEFLSESLGEVLGKSKHTIKTYQDSLTLYLRYLEEEKGLDRKALDLKHFKNERITEWLNWLEEYKGNSPQTINIRASGLRKFLAFLKEKDLDFDDVFKESQKIKSRKAIPVKEKKEVLSPKEIQILLEIPNARRPSGKRDQALYTLMYDSAARVDEILSLKIEDLHLDLRKPYISIHNSKNNKTRSAHISKKTVGLLKTYLKEFHGSEPDESAYLFFSRNVGPKVKMTSQNVLDRLKGYAAKAHESAPQISAQINSQDLRKARARHLLEEGMPLVQISYLLGHIDADYTMKYLDLDTKSGQDGLLEKKVSLAEFCGLRKAQPRKFKPAKKS